MTSFSQQWRLEPQRPEAAPRPQPLRMWRGRTPAVPPDIEPTPWMDLGACRGCDPALFFPAIGDPDCSVQAKLICSTCIVRTDCLEHALAHHERHGTWGGTSPK